MPWGRVPFVSAVPTLIEREMKLLVISAAFPPLKVGEADHALHLCHHLSDRGLDVRVLTTKRDVSTVRLPFKVHPVMPHWLWSDLPRLASFLRHCSPDAILLIYTDRDYDYHPMITFAPTVAKALLPRAVFVTQFETEYMGCKASLLTRASLKLFSRCAGPRFLDQLLGTLLCKSDNVIVLSERHQAMLAKRFPAIGNRTSVIPPPPLMPVIADNNGASREQGRRALGVKPDDFLIAYYGYIYPDKGIETLFKGFQIVNNQKGNTRLIMVGASLSFLHCPSYLAGIQELAKQLAIEDKIIWTGEYALGSEEASLYFRACDLCVLPFDHGVTLNRSSLAAAAAHGLPIVTTGGAKIESPFKDQENVFLCPPQDANALALAIDSLMTNPESSHRLRQGVLELARNFFSWDKAVARTIEALST